jgi:putative ABC transport system permease protein
VLAENVIVSLLAAVLGLPLALAVTGALRALGPATLPRADAVVVDPVALAFGLGLALAAGVVSGLLPALQAAHADPQATLREGGPRSTGGGGRPARALAAAQVGLALVLVVGAFLLLRSLDRLRSVDRGFPIDGVLTARVEPPMSVHPEEADEQAFLSAFVRDRARAARFYDQLVEGVESLPGVRAAAINRMPLSGSWWTTAIAVEGRPASSGHEPPPVLARIVTRGYFETLEIALRRGRGFGRQDAESSPLVAVVSESLARAYWPGRDPLGQRIALDSDPPPDAPRYTVVGIVADVRQSALAEEPPPVVYTLVSQSFFGFFGNWGMDLVIRAANQAPVLPALREKLHALDPTLPLAAVRPMTEVVREDTARTRTASLLLGVFAAAALALAAVGLFGVWSAAVSQRRREFGVRMALGARPVQVLGMVLGEALLTTAVGGAVGALAAAALARLARSLLFGVSPLDPVTFVATAAVLGLTVLLACALPALRAARVDPTGSLRSE